MSNRRKRHPVATIARPPAPATYWNGEPAPARKVAALVGEADFPHYWAREEGLIGSWIPAVEITYGGSTFYLDDRDERGWNKVTHGLGSPRYGHRNLVPVEVRSR